MLAFVWQFLFYEQLLYVCLIYFDERTETKIFKTNNFKTVIN